MKMKVEIDLDWLKEDEDIEEQIKESLISSVVEGCFKKLSETIEREAASRLDEALDGHIASILADLMDRQIRITDKFGDVQKTYENVDEMLDEKFENFLTQPVDKEGKPYSHCSYGDRYTRIEHLISKKVEEKAKEKAEKIMNDTNGKIKAFFTQELNNKIADRLFRQLDLESLLK